MIINRGRAWLSLLAGALPLLYLLLGGVFGLDGGQAWVGAAAWALAVIYLGWRGLARRAALPRTGLEVVLLAGLLALCLSLAFSPDPRMGLEQASASVGYVLLFVLLVDGFETGLSRSGAVYGLLLAGGLAAALAALETYAWYADWWRQAGSVAQMPPYPYRLVSVLGHPNFYMAFVNLLAPLALVIFLGGRRRALRVLAALWLAFYLVSVPFSSSRGGWLGMAAWVGVLGLLWVTDGGRWRRGLAWLNRYKAAGWAGLGGLLVLGLLALLRFYLAFAAHPSHGSDLFGGRSQLWGAALRIWQSSPLTGAGVGRYLYEYLRVSPDFPPGFWSFHAHNLYLTVLAEQGLLGFAAFMALVIWGGVHLLRWYRGSPPESRLWSAAFVAGLASLAVHSIFDDFTAVLPVMILAAWLAALLRAQGLRSEVPARRMPMAPPLAGLLVLALPLAGLAGWLAWSSAPLEAGVQRAAASAGSAEDWRQAALLVSESARRDPAFAYTQVQSGLAWAKAWSLEPDPANLARARAYLAQAIAIEPSLSLVWANAALLDWHAGERALAVERMQQAEALSPNESSYKIHLGWFAEQQGEPQAALRWYEQGLQVWPGLAAHPFWQTSSLRRQAAEPVLASYQQALAAAPPTWKIAQEALLAGDLVQAREALAQAQAEGQDTAAVLAVRAALADAAGQQAEARRAGEALVNVMLNDTLLSEPYIANMYARFHKRPGFRLEVVPGYLKLMPEVGQLAVLQRLYQQQVSANDCDLAARTWQAAARYLSPDQVGPQPYPRCGAPLPSIHAVGD